MKPSSLKRTLGFVLVMSVFVFSAPTVATAWPATSAAQSPEAMQRLQDRISREVYHELIMLPQMNIFDHLAYKMDGINVTLMGEVVHPILKDSAEKAVKHIEGVGQVKNEIEILPPSSGDDRIRIRVARAIFNDARLFRYSLEAVPSIHIIVKSGHVKLKGAVDNQTDKDAAGIRASGVPGIFSVENELEVAKPAKKKKA